MSATAVHKQQFHIWQVKLSEDKLVIGSEQRSDSCGDKKDVGVLLLVHDALPTTTNTNSQCQGSLERTCVSVDLLVDRNVPPTLRFTMSLSATETVCISFFSRSNASVWCLKSALACARTQQRQRDPAS